MAEQRRRETECSGRQPQAGGQGRGGTQKNAPIAGSVEGHAGLTCVAFEVCGRAARMGAVFCRQEEFLRGGNVEEGHFYKKRPSSKNGKLSFPKTALLQTVATAGIGGRPQLDAGALDFVAQFLQPRAEFLTQGQWNIRVQRGDADAVIFQIHFLGLAAGEGTVAHGLDEGQDNGVHGLAL